MRAPPSRRNSHFTVSPRASIDSAAASRPAGSSRSRRVRSAGAGWSGRRALRAAGTGRPTPGRPGSAARRPGSRERVAVHVVAGGHPRQATARSGLGRRYRASVPVLADRGCRFARPAPPSDDLLAPSRPIPSTTIATSRASAMRAGVFGEATAWSSNMGLILGVAGADPQPAVVRLGGLAGLIAGPSPWRPASTTPCGCSPSSAARAADRGREPHGAGPNTRPGSWPTSTSSGASTRSGPRRGRGHDERPRVAPGHAREELGIDPQQLGSPLAAALVVRGRSRSGRRSR